MDGKYGDKNHAALIDALADDTDDTAPVPETPGQEEPNPTPQKVVIVSSSGKVNIRKGNGTNYARITQVGSGTVFGYVATAANGWYAVVVNGQVGWVSGQYAKKE